MFLKEFLQLLLTKYKSTTSFILFPVTSVFVWVVPKEVGNQTAVRHIRGLGDTLDLLKTDHVFWYTSVHTHDFFVDKGYQRHVIKAIPELLPECDLVPSLDLIEETIDSGDGL
jgi:hypothetical protein